MDLGIVKAQGRPIPNPLPPSWLGLPAAPLTPPSWATIGTLTAVEIRNLLAQIGYDSSSWNYQLIGTNNKLGRYQFTAQTLESYGLLASGAVDHYGTDAVNYKSAWKPAVIGNNANSYANYSYNINNLNEFLTVTVAQEHLAYQRLLDLYNDSLKINVIQDSDSPETIAGMIYVAWVLGVGAQPAGNDLLGTGAYAWRYSNIGPGADAYNSGRYSILILSK